jgi:hypothetical protein
VLETDVLRNVEIAGQDQAAMLTGHLALLAEADRIGRPTLRHHHT